MPDGTIVGARGPHGDFAPDSPLNDWFRGEYEARYGDAPNYASYKFAQAILGIKTAYEKAADGAGEWPNVDQVIAAFENLSWTGPSGLVEMKLGNGHQAVQQNPIGLSKYDADLGRVTVTDVVYYDADCVNPPEGTGGIAWIQAGFPGANCD